jgi:hypothetical protein
VEEVLSKLSVLLLLLSPTKLDDNKTSFIGTANSSTSPESIKRCNATGPAAIALAKPGFPVKERINHS